MGDGTWVAGKRVVDPCAFGSTPNQRPIRVKKKKGSHCQTPKHPKKKRK